MRFTNVSVVMGTKNEEKAIGKVIEDILQTTNNEAEIIVVDSSIDRTAEIAKSKGAVLIKQKPQGYGIALKKGILSATRDIVITTDCDGTYPMEMIPQFIEKINEGYDVVSGVRLQGFLGLKTKNMTKFNAFGNWVFALIVTLLYFKRVHDTTTGMRAYKREMLHSIEWKENTGLSAELLFKPILYKKRIIEISIPYRERIGETKLDPLRGGLQILGSILKYRIHVLFLYIFFLSLLIGVIIFLIIFL
ncbi:MAG: glycosyltransferase [Candidatus Heimdallarchaeaceae archaeon]